ncbi:MAG: hypothetical protein AB7G87_01165 [Clostridia bacterium]
MNSSQVLSNKVEKTNDGFQIIFSSEQGDVIYTLNYEQFISLRENIENTIEPDRVFNSRIKKLKEFKRQAYKSYLDERDPEIKAQKLKLYLESKKLVSDLEG